MAQLTPDQQAQLASFMDACRPLMGEVARIFARLAHLEDAWSGGIGAIVNLLDDGQIVDVPTSLAGAQPVTKESVVQTMSDFGQAMALFNNDANRQRYIAFAGLQNTMPG